MEELIFYRFGTQLEKQDLEKSFKAILNNSSYVAIVFDVNDPDYLCIGKIFNILNLTDSHFLYFANLDEWINEIERY